MAERKAYLLRIDPDLWAEVERLAQAELRSVNGQIEYLLRESNPFFAKCSMLKPSRVDVCSDFRVSTGQTNTSITCWRRL